MRGIGGRELRPGKNGIAATCGVWNESQEAPRLSGHILHFITTFILILSNVLLDDISQIESVFTLLECRLVGQGGNVRIMEKYRADKK